LTRLINNSINILFGAMISFIIALVLFFQNADYVTKKTFLLPNWLLIVLSVLVFAAFCICYKLASKKVMGTSIINADRLVLLATVVLFLIQLYITYNIFFLSDWDVAQIRKNIFAIHNGDQQFLTEFGDTYLSVYPNNLLIIFVGVFLLKLNSVFGVFTGEHLMMCCTVLTCLFNALSCFLVYKSTAYIANKKVAIVSYIISLLLFGFSPWSVIYYTDSFGLIFPILSFYLFVKPVKNKYLLLITRFLSVLVAIAGYFIKPQCVIALIAIVIVAFAKTIGKINLQSIIKFLCLVASCVVCFVAVNTAVNCQAAQVGYNIDGEKTLGAPHFFMMGMNNTVGGVYSEEDIIYSRSFATVDERTDANLKVAFDRINKMGFVGLSKHIAKKLLITFNDGTFAWGVDGTFFYEMPQGENGKIASVLKSIYYRDGSGYDYFHLFSQFVWLFVLLTMLVSCFKKADAQNEYKLAIVRLALIGLILFMAIFEVRARYLYTYAPFFCMLSALGASKAYTLIKICLSKLKAIIKIPMQT